MVAIPRAPISATDAIIEVRALQAIERSPEAANFSVQDRAALSARIHGDGTKKGAKDRLKGIRDSFLSPKLLVWYGKYAQAVTLDDSKSYAAADYVMQRLYGDSRNRFAHDDFNLLRQKLDKTKNAALKEAVEKLLAVSEPLIIDTSFAQQRGDMKYLQKCLLNQGALRQVKAEGSRLRCELELDEWKYEGKLPALAAIVREVRGLDSAAKLNLVSLFRRYRMPQYGQGPVSMALTLAFVRRALGDSIRFKAEESSINELPVTSFDSVIDLVDGQYAAAFLTHRPLRPEERALVAEVYAVFGEPSSAATGEPSLNDGYDALRTWWDALPSIARVAKIYSVEQHPQIGPFIAAMEKIAARDASSFLFDDLPSAFGFDSGLALSYDTVNLLRANLSDARTTIESGPEQVEARVFEGLRTLFDVKQRTYSDLAEAIRDWFNALDTGQHDTMASWHTSDSKPLLLYFKDITNPRATFFDQLPASTDYGLTRLRDWVGDRVDEYLARIQRGKELIEVNRVKVAPPEVIVTGAYDQENGVVRFTRPVKVEFRASQPGGRVFVLEGGGDPTDPSGPRTEANGQVFTIESSKTLRYAVQDSDGNWGRVDALEFLNETQKYKVVVQSGFQKGEDRATFVLPKDDESLAATCRSLFHELLRRGIISEPQLLARLGQLLDELRTAAKG